jgi:hypothetical protein
VSSRQAGRRWRERACGWWAATTHQEMARCAEVVSAAAARAGPGTPLAAVLSSWPGSLAALAAYVSRIEVTHARP